MPPILISSAAIREGSMAGSRKRKTERGRRGEVWEGREFEKSAQYCCWRRISKDSILPSKPAWADTAENLLRDIHNMNQYVSTRKKDNNCSVELLIIYSLSSIYLFRLIHHLKLQLWFPLGKVFIRKRLDALCGRQFCEKETIALPRDFSKDFSLPLQLIQPLLLAQFLLGENL